MQDVKLTLPEVIALCNSVLNDRTHDIDDTDITLEDELLQNHELPEIAVEEQVGMGLTAHKGHSDGVKAESVDVEMEEQLKTKEHAAKQMQTMQVETAELEVKEVETTAEETKQSKTEEPKARVGTTEWLTVEGSGAGKVPKWMRMPPGPEREAVRQKLIKLRKAKADAEEEVEWEVEKTQVETKEANEVETTQGGASEQQANKVDAKEGSPEGGVPQHGRLEGGGPQELGDALSKGEDDSTGAPLGVAKSKGKARSPPL